MERKKFNPKPVLAICNKERSRPSLLLELDDKLDDKNDKLDDKLDDKVSSRLLESRDELLTYMYTV